MAWCWSAALFFKIDEIWDGDANNAGDDLVSDGVGWWSAQVGSWSILVISLQIFNILYKGNAFQKYSSSLYKEQNFGQFWEKNDVLA